MRGVLLAALRQGAVRLRRRLRRVRARVPRLSRLVLVELPVVVPLPRPSLVQETLSIQRRGRPRVLDPQCRRMSQCATDLPSCF
jgi:hypothetical protein